MINLTILSDSVLAKATSPLVRFAQELKQFCHDDVSVLKDVEITSDLISVDAIVDYHGMIVAVIAYVQNEDYLQVVRRDISKIMRRAQVQLGIVITASGKYYLRKYSNTRSSVAKIETIAEEIQAVYRSIRTDLDPAEVKLALLSLFEEAPVFDGKERIRSLFENACDRLIIDHGSILMDSEDEDAIMLEILGGPLHEDMSICRYTSLDSLFKLLDGAKHAMCSPVSMNDKHECDYADSFMPWHVNRSRGEVEIEADNSYFLLSCSDIKESDVLTMWRLYGDDAKGVCLEYKVEADKVDNDRYFLGRVSYGRKTGDGKFEHPELSFIAYMQAKAISPGWYFVFGKWYIWKFFFKSWTYRDENEIRLIYKPVLSNDEEFARIKWYKDQTNGIFNRMALIPIDFTEGEDFPLSISRIILGPHSPEANRNREQIWYMTLQSSVAVPLGFSVDVSTISNYR